jgi:hypothetical protein
MMPVRWQGFSEIWSHDFEWATTCGTGKPIPHTYAAHDLISGREILLTGDELRRTKRVPIDVRRSACLSYNFEAEASCFEVLKWEQPWWPFDPFAEFLAMMNGLTGKDVFEPGEGDKRIRFRQIDALRFFGIEVDSAKEAHKREMQLRSAKGEPFTPEERKAISDYCADDTRDLAALFKAMRDKIDFAAALIRARYMIVIGQQRHRGIPIDYTLFNQFKAKRFSLCLELIQENPFAAQFYREGHFSESRFLEWAEAEEIGWPHNNDGSPVLDQHTLSRIAIWEPRIKPLVSLRSKLSKFDDIKMTVLSDGRIRPQYWPLGTRTGRNRPDAKEYLMLQAEWLRGFVLAPPGRALAQVDFKAQEVYIAAALSGDRQLLEDLETDPYLILAVKCGFAQPDATKKTHGTIRDLFKTIFLGLGYGMGVRTLAAKLATDMARAREVRTQFRRRYRTFYEWLESVVLSAYTTHHLESPLGWPLTVGPKLDSFTLRNHLIQATGGDILRASCLLAQDARLCTIATLHDAILIESDAHQIKADAAQLAGCMTQGAEHVIGIPVPAEVEFTARRYQLSGLSAELFTGVRKRISANSRYLFKAKGVGRG